MSSVKLRRGVVDAGPNDPPAPRGATAYLVIYNAVREQDGLIYGRLDNERGEHCAIGSYFAQRNHCPLPADIIDEVAAVNDSAPKATPKQRRLMVLRWLRWKLAQAHMPGFENAKAIAK